MQPNILESISKFNLPTGIPFIYELDEDLQPIGELANWNAGAQTSGPNLSIKFLCDDDEVEFGMKKVAAQTYRKTSICIA